MEHDEEIIRNSDWTIDLGPGAGIHGGNVVFEGTVNQILNGHKSITGDYLKDKSLIKLENKKRIDKGKLVLKGATQNNLKNITVDFPLGKFITVTGVSGSGKSSLINETLLKGLEANFYKTTKRPGSYKEIIGLDKIDKVIAIDQSPIGRTPRSNPATYIGAFTPIRELYSNTELSKEWGYAPGQFSFNVRDWRCYACEEDAVKQ